MRSRPAPRRYRLRRALRWSALAAVAAIAIAPMSVANGTTLTPKVPGSAQGTRSVTYRGYQVKVPRSWRVVDLTASPHACIRFDRPAVYVGRPGDQRSCPPHLIGGAPGLLVEPLDMGSVAATTSSTVRASASGAVPPASMSSQGPVDIYVAAAGVLVAAVYGPQSAARMKRVVSGGRVLPTAQPVVRGSLVRPATAPGIGASVPGRYLGKGFEACTAPSESAMAGWLGSGVYGAVGVYIGGVSRGCSQPNLTAGWVSTEVADGWHLIPTYVGLQAPCTSFYNRMSYTPSTAKAQGRADAADAAAQAGSLGMAAPSTIYSDIEAYDNTIGSCVSAVLSYVSGWTRGLHQEGYQAGVYSSASSGMRDLSGSYSSTSYNRPDDIWMAWWNALADIDGGSYVPDRQWSHHQRIHQYAGGAWETHGGYQLNVDRDYLDLTTAVALPVACPTNLNFSTYRVLRSSDHGNQVLATQCQLARRGFNPGRASGTIRWRTAAAISAFNVSRGLPDRAVVGRRSWTAMLSGGRTRVLQVGATGPVVMKLQRALSASLSRQVSVTGVFDHPTHRAVVDFQRANGLVVDGTASHATWAALRSGG